MVKNLHFWNKIGANNAIVDTPEIGYKIPFISTLKSAYSQNNRLAIQNSDFVQDYRTWKSSLGILWALSQQLKVILVNFR